MSSKPGGRLAKGLIAGALLAAALGCGKQGPPLPPLRNVPAPTKDLSVVQQGPRLLASLTYPTVRPAGTALGGISTVEVWSTALPAPGGTASPVDARSFTTLARPLRRWGGGDVPAWTTGSRIEIALPLPPVTAPAA